METNVGTAIEAAKAGFKAGVKEGKSSPKNIFDTITNSNLHAIDGTRRIHENLENFDFDAQETYNFDYAYVIKPIPHLEIAVKRTRAPNATEKALIEYYNKYQGCIMHYFANENARKANETSTLTFQTNWVPFSNISTYQIPSGVPVAVPRWIFHYFAEKAPLQNKIIKEVKYDPAYVEHELKEHGFAAAGSYTFVQGPKLIRFYSLNKMPVRLIDWIPQ